MSDMEAEPAVLEDEALADDPDFDGDIPEDPDYEAAGDPAASEHQDVAEQEGDDSDEWPDVPAAEVSP